MAQHLRILYRALLDEIRHVGHALQRIIYLVRKFMGHLSGARGALLSNDFGLLFLLSITHRREISQHRHQSRIICVESFCSAMGHDKNRAPCLFSLPWKQYAICYQGRFDTKNFKKLLRDSKVLRVSTF